MLRLCESMCKQGIVQGVSPFGNDFESKRLEKGQKNPENAWISGFGLLCHSRLFPVVCNALQHCNKLCITGSRFGRFTYLTWGYSHSIIKKCSAFTISPLINSWLFLIVKRIDFDSPSKNSFQTQLLHASSSSEFSV